MRNPTLVLGVVALGAAALLTGCAGSSTSSGGSSTVTVGVSGNIFDMSIRVADTNGYFTKQGLKVKYATLTASTAPTALQSGSVDFLNASPNSFLAAIGKGLPQTAIATNGLGNPLGIIVSTTFAKAHNLTASTPAAQVARALSGSNAGTSSANTKGEASVFLKANGVDPGTMKWVSLPSPAADKAALKSHEIDWFITSEPTPLQMQAAGDGVVVADPVKVPQWSAAQAGYSQFVVVRSDYAKQNSATVKKFAAAVQQATKFMNQHLTDPSVRKAAGVALPNVPPAVLTSSLQQVEWPQSDAMSTSGWNTTLDFINSLGALPKKATVSSDDWTNKYLPSGGSA